MLKKNVKLMSFIKVFKENEIASKSFIYMGIIESFLYVKFKIRNSYI